MEPSPEGSRTETAAEAAAEDFAQCSSCMMWAPDKDRCAIHGGRVEVRGTMSCGLYVHGDPKGDGMGMVAAVTPEESGLEDRRMRCENCGWFRQTAEEAGTCRLYVLLNNIPRSPFRLDDRVSADGCCNANTPPPVGAERMKWARQVLVEA